MFLLHRQHQLLFSFVLVRFSDLFYIPLFHVALATPTTTNIRGNEQTNANGVWSFSTLNNDTLVADNISYSVNNNNNQEDKLNNRISNNVITDATGSITESSLSTPRNSEHDELPTWDKLDQRELPKWYDESKFGIFIHWGVFSVPSYRSEWFWKDWQDGKGDGAYNRFIQRTERPGFSYNEYASRFTADMYDPNAWANLFAQSGAQYVVLTSKHHDGYCNWNSTNVHTTWNWNVMDVGPRRDILGELSEAIKATPSPHTGNLLKWGVYHSLYEWYNPMYLADKANQYKTKEFVTSKTIPELYDLVNRYQPELIWSDGEWEADSTYWNSLDFLHWYTNQSAVASTAVYNDRWGSEIRCRHGSFLTCDDRFNPGKLQTRKFENAFTIDKTTWGYSRVSNYSDYMTVKELIHTMIEVVAFNGNVLINIGPAADGTIHPIFVDRLLGIGDWLRVNGDAIYKTRPWEVCQNETSSNVFYTINKVEGSLYITFTKWPKTDILHLECVITSSNSTIRFLGLFENKTVPNHVPILWKYATTSSSGIDITLPKLTPDEIPCEHAWVLAISNVSNLNPEVEKS